MSLCIRSSSPSRRIRTADERRESQFKCTCWMVGILTLWSLGALWVVYQEEMRESYLIMKRLMRVRWLDLLTNSTVGLESHHPLIRGTRIEGKEAVERFRNHLACFSESGQWVHDPVPRHLPWNSMGDVEASICDERHRRIQGRVSDEKAEAIATTGAFMDWSVREELKWVWQTNSSCTFMPVDRDDLCKRIGSRGNVMVVGDSINNEISWSLMNHLLPSYTTGLTRLGFETRKTDGVYEMCADVLGGAGKGFKVSFVRNDRLSAVRNSSMDKWKNLWHNWEFPWLHLLSEYDVKLLLLNRGAHYEEDLVLTEALNRTFSILSTDFPDLQIIYRNTPPGHVRCQTYNKPLQKRQDDWSLPRDYYWADFYRQNQLSEQIVKEFQYIYMDVDTMLSLRPEGHISRSDCLHYCLPGPLDLSIQYLYNILLLL
ncbi:hypothetical protein R1flu_015298 [Riccia fluitans]|uniref:Trichome birefringence-like C-terminal domain-containing protein n=1 Tax=Riccia fluitans TaxID=41844 RepID=A0ABD1YLN8_9MARC